MTVEIVTVTNRIPTEPYYRFEAWRKSLTRFNYEPTILGMDKPWKGLMTKPRLLREWLRGGGCKADCMIFTDSWDVVFLRHPQEIAGLWDSIGRPWICGAEQALFPPGDEKAWPESGTPYRFLNSGVIISTPGDMLAILEAMDLDAIPDDYERPDGSQHHGNDQEELQKFFLTGKFPMLLDTQCRFVWNLCDVPWESYTSMGAPFNRDTETSPYIVHANGGAKDGPIFLDILKRLGL